ncbi:MAG: DMT family transporter [Herpetosiphon sp.]
MTTKQFSALVLLAAVWGASFLLIKVAVAHPDAPSNFGPLTLVSVRLGLAGCVLYLILWSRGGSLGGNHWPALAVLGLVNAAIPYFLFSWGEQRINSNLAAIYNATTPLWSVILAGLFVRTERLSLVRSLGVVVGFLGIVYLFAGNIRGLTLSSGFGQLACVVAGLCYALANMWTRLRLGVLPPLTVAAGQLVWGTVWILPFSLAIEQPWLQRPSYQAVFAVVVLSLVGTAAALLVYVWLLSEVGATRSSQVTYLLPVFGLAWGRLIGEPITPRIVVALAIILVGSLIINGGFGLLAKMSATLE